MPAPTTTAEVPLPAWPVPSLTTASHS
jgi:hypothetical protein